MIGGAIVLVVILAVVIGMFVAGGAKSSNSNGSPVDEKASAAQRAAAYIEKKNAPLDSNKPTVTFTMSFTGDCCLGNDESFGYETRMPEYFDKYGATYFFQNVKSIFEADDYTVVDMEGTFTTRTTRNYETFAFKADPEYVDILTSGNVQAATLANNHSHDYGDGSYNDTWETLEKANIVPFGYDDIAYVDIKGVKVALIGMYELDEYLGIKENMLENIGKARENGATVIIMCAHWGEERMYVPDEIQVELAHEAIDAGVDLIVGCHPHRVQGIEEYNGKYIAYSMGNFCFAGNNAPADMDCYIFQQTFTVQGDKVELNDNVKVIPCSISSEEDTNNYQPTPATGEKAAGIMAKLADLNSQLAATYGVTTLAL